MKKENIIYLFIVLISLICNKAFAHDIEVKNADGATIYYDWVNNQSELKVSYCGPNYYSYDNEYFGDVVIPESVEYGGSTYSVTSIGREAFRECSDLTSVTIPNSVTSIEAQVFAECSGLISVTIPNSVTSIGIWAFSDCSSLTSVTIPKSVKTIYSPIFQSCSNLVSINVEEGNSVYDSRENCNAIIYTADNVLINGCNSTIIPNSVTSIDALAFSGCRDLTSVTIPNSVTSVGNGAFFECSGLTSVIIPNSVTSIGDNAFDYCSSLNSIYVEEGNSVYDSRNNCNAIIRTADNVLITGCNRTIIPNSVTSIGGGAFSDCSGLTSVTIPNSVTSIGGSAFQGCSGLTSVTIPNSVTSIGGYAFWGCSELTSVTIGNSVTSIGGGAFWECSELTSVHISDIAAWCNMKFEDERSNPLYYANHLYLNGEEIKELEIPNSVTTIDNNAFSNCSSLTSVLIPNSVTSIGIWAFSDCSSLTSVHISDIVAWCNIKFGGELSNPLYYANHLYLNGEEIKDLEIPNSLTTIDEYAFCGCSGLTSVLIPNSVTSISYETFQGCSGLTSVTIPNSVTSIGGSAFEGCSGLTSVTIPNSVTSIGRDAFRYCSGITDVYCLAEIVPDTGFGVFDGTPIEKSTLYVPAKSVDAYRASWPWSNFKKIVAIGSIPADDLKSKDYIYEAGINNSWGAKEQPLYSANKDGIYRGFFYAQEADWTGGKGAFKFTGAFNSWSEGNYGIGNINADGLSGTLIDDGNSANIMVTPGFYRADVNLGNMTYELTPISSIGIIGSAQAGGWDTDTDLTYNPETLAWEGTIKLTADQFKFRANHSWDINWGGSIKNLIQDESNLMIDEAGTYFIQFFPLCETKSYATLTLVSDPNPGDDPTSGLCGETVDYFYDKATKTLTISGKGAIYDYDNGSNKAPWSAYADEIRKIEIESGITSIGYFAFYKCSGITSLSIPATVGYIGSSAFEDCTSLTSLTLNEGLLFFGGSAFEGCTALKTLTIPSTVNTISINAFKNCKGITDVYCYVENVPDTHFDAFDATPTEKSTLHVPANAVEAYRTSWPWSDFKEIVAIEEGAPDGIISVKQSDDCNGDYYDLTGRRVLHPRKGLYIRNGKKVILR